MTQQPNERLLPCPFDSGEARVHAAGAGYAAWCVKCHTIGPPMKTESEAIRAWNTRVPAVQDEGMVAKVLLDAWDRIHGDSVGWGAFKTAVDEGRYVDAIKAMSLYAETSSRSPEPRPASSPI